MSRFHIGQDVFVGWTPDSHCIDPIARAARCSIGVIRGGPFEPDYRDPPMTERWWQVVIDGDSFDAAERILFPFDNPDATTETTNEKEVEA